VIALSVDAWQLLEAMKRTEDSARSARSRLEMLFAQAEAASRAKDEFLMVVSHELRTPLNAILGWAALLQKQGAEAHPDIPSVRRGLTVIERNARAQARLIEDVLDVSRIITGKLKLRFETLDFAAVVVAAVDVVRPAAKAKGISLAVTCDPEHVVLRGDPDRLQQVVWNLTSNAVKFTPENGHVEVRLEQSGSMIRLIVEDSGPGIATDMLPHVFERFRQADSSTTRQHGGLGLGLAIVRHLVELHGGNVVAESNGPSLGARFIVAIPVPAVDLLVPSSTVPSSGVTTSPTPPHAFPVQTLAGARTLLVEDDADARELVAEVLHAAGAAVTAVDGPLAALEALDRATFDVIVSDIGMARVDGYTLMRKVRTLPADRGGSTPAVALTAYAAREDARRALDAGFQAHLAKPIEPAALVRAVAELIDARKQRLG
jgi:CheY-like chemotaxis protein